MNSRPCVLLAAIGIAAALCCSAVKAETYLAIGWGMNGDSSTSAQADVTPATAAEIRETVGNVTYEVICPLKPRSVIQMKDAPETYLERNVKITLEKPGVAYRQLPVLSTLLDTAVKKAWADCPLLVDTGAFGGLEDQKQLGWAEIYAQPTETSPMTLVARAERFGVLRKEWFKIVDVYADAEKAQAEAQAAEVERQRQAADQNARYVQWEQQRQANIARVAAVREEQDAKFNAFLDFAGVVLTLLVIGFLFAKWESVLRLYYWLTPHPAGEAVRRAIDLGETLDGETFARLVAVSPRNDIEASVRDAQARGLADRWQTHQAELEKESEVLLRAEQVRLERERETLDAQRELLNAAIAHERAAARVAALREASR